MPAIRRVPYSAFRNFNGLGNLSVVSAPANLAQEMKVTADVVALPQIPVNTAHLVTTQTVPANETVTFTPDIITGKTLTLIPNLIGGNLLTSDITKIKVGSGLEVDAFGELIPSESIGWGIGGGSSIVGSGVNTESKFNFKIVAIIAIVLILLYFIFKKIK